MRSVEPLIFKMPVQDFGQVGRTGHRNQGRLKRLPRSPSLVGRRLAIHSWQTAVSVYTDREFKSHPRRHLPSPFRARFLLFRRKKPVLILLRFCVGTRFRSFVGAHEFLRPLSGFPLFPLGITNQESNAKK
jgi:hypothetical protein